MLGIKNFKWLIAFVAISFIINTSIYPTIAYAGGLKFGIISVVKDKIEELKEKKQQKSKEMDVKQSTTNKEGKAYFIDNSTYKRVTITVINSDTKNPIEDIKVTYYDGDGFEVFLCKDPAQRYLPSMGFYQHNSDHTIEMGKWADGIYEISIIEDREKQEVLWSWQDKTAQWNYIDQIYERTIDYEEQVEIMGRYDVVLDFLWGGILYIIGTSFPFSFSEILHFICPDEQNPPPRYDLYNYQGELYADSLAIVPSNIPTVTVNEPQVSGNDIVFSWEGHDKTTYEKPSTLPVNKDLTVYLGPNTKDEDYPCDLTYSYKIINSNDLSVYQNWTNTSNKQITITNMPNGNYTVQVKVTDEVGNISTMLTGNPDEKHFTVSSNGGEVLTNVALNKATTASGIWYDDPITGEDDLPEKAVDGNMNTRWNNDGFNNPTTSWWQVDLEQSYEVEKIIIRWYGISATNFKVQYWNGDSWEIIVDFDTGTTSPEMYSGDAGINTFEFSPISTDKVRFYSDSLYTDFSGNNTITFWEFEVYAYGE